MKKLCFVVGTRPEIIKLAALIQRAKQDARFDVDLVHTGQHYDWNLSGLFFQQLGVPTPHAFLNVQGDGQIPQFADMLVRLQQHWMKHRPDVVLVEGDTNSALAGGFTAAREGIPVGHVEAGCRSFDPTMPEERNRVMLATLAALHFAPTNYCCQNLLREGVPRTAIHFTGHPYVETLHASLPFLNRTRIQRKLGVTAGNYVYVTVHRRENIEDPTRLRHIIRALHAIEQPIVFPVHPHTQRRLKERRINAAGPHMIATTPLGYYESLRLIRDAQVVLTDSGGVQQEAALLGTPCLTLRRNTEWVETVQAGVNFLTLPTTAGILRTLRHMLTTRSQIVKRLTRTKTLFGDTRATARILDILHQVSVQEASLDAVKNGLPTLKLLRLKRRAQRAQLHPVTTLVFDPQGHPVAFDQDFQRGQSTLLFGPSKRVEQTTRW